MPKKTTILTCTIQTLITKTWRTSKTNSYNEETFLIRQISESLSQFKTPPTKQECDYFPCNYSLEDKSPPVSCRRVMKEVWSSRIISRSWAERQRRRRACAWLSIIDKSQISLTVQIALQQLEGKHFAVLSFRRQMKLVPRVRARSSAPAIGQHVSRNSAI